MYNYRRFLANSTKAKIKIYLSENQNLGLLIGIRTRLYLFLQLKHREYFRLFMFLFFFASCFPSIVFYADLSLFVIHLESNAGRSNSLQRRDLHQSELVVPQHSQQQQVT